MKIDEDSDQSVRKADEIGTKDGDDGCCNGENNVMMLKMLLTMTMILRH